MEIYMLPSNWGAHGIEYKQMNVKDFTPPSIEICEAVFQTIKEASEAGKKVGAHCGEGFGRIGTILAAVKLKNYCWRSVILLI